MIQMDGVPEHVRGGLERYLLQGIRPGNFLTAVLSNDLKGAFSYGDANSIAGLEGLVRFLYNHAPASAWGSPELVEQWIEQGQDFRDTVAKVRHWTATEER